MDTTTQQAINRVLQLIHKAEQRCTRKNSRRRLSELGSMKSTLWLLDTTQVKDAKVCFAFLNESDWWLRKCFTTRELPEARKAWQDLVESM